MKTTMKLMCAMSVFVKAENLSSATRVTEMIDAEAYVSGFLLRMQSKGE